MQKHIIVNFKITLILGMGGALTEAAAYTYSRMSAEKQQQLVALYFGGGNDYNFCRLHIQSCDFALGNYAYVDDAQDKELNGFSIERDRKYIIPLAKAALGKNPEIQFLASPWSPPAFMKTNGKMNHGGKLKQEYCQMWADMVARYVSAYQDEGIAVQRLSVQNEPAAVQTWDSCIFSGAEEAEFACRYLRPALDRAQHQDVKINVWDHNKEKILERAAESFGVEGAREAIDGVAFHWYTGDHFDALAAAGNSADDMQKWERYGKQHVLYREGYQITGDVQVVKMGDVWVMNFYAYQGGSAHAYDIFAISENLVDWTIWDGEPLTDSTADYDGRHAHKPWIIRYEGVVYHFYCARQ